MRRAMAAALLALVLGGCAVVPPAPPAALELPRQANWTLQGRIGVQSGEQSLSGQIHWRHRVESDEVLMTSPLGQGVARIVRDAEGVALEMPNQPTRRAPDAESLTREALGYALPVAGLTWWVQGRPDPGSAFETTRDAGGRIEQLRQDGWVIDYLQYAADARPRRLVVTREGLEIRLVADRWQAE
ncbi:MAG: lipoprotein insertase outer membrane protein LolB [Gammaproteobacteria bacterium]|nr:lipoprotein insertase outer membrane protein LolB [Gammaproteobacteria bacterium]MBU1409065.1 lipoprotein insertase outer membrane protein LolB [Gammaproteobacteria bacterium]MBU1530961.1 lipoprotein insertase outer membrane protein LolB [Gammaproteobacteria bacterium]